MSCRIRRITWSAFATPTTGFLCLLLAPMYTVPPLVLAKATTSAIDRVQPPAAAGGALVKGLDDGVAGLARLADVVKGRDGHRTRRARDRKVGAGQRRCAGPRKDRSLSRISVRRSPTPSRSGLLGIGRQAMCVGALDAVHPSRVLGLAAVVELGRAPPALALQVGHLQGVQVRILGPGDLGLAAKAQVAHRHAVCRVGVRGDHQTACFVDQLVGGEHVGGRADLGRADVELIDGNF